MSSRTLCALEKRCTVACATKIVKFLKRSECPCQCLIAGWRHIASQPLTVIFEWQSAENRSKANQLQSVLNDGPLQKHHVPNAACQYFMTERCKTMLAKSCLKCGHLRTEETDKQCNHDMSLIQWHIGSTNRQNQEFNWLRDVRRSSPIARFRMSSIPVLLPMAACFASLCKRKQDKAG